jgi:hypothetical protein
VGGAVYFCGWRSLQETKTKSIFKEKRFLMSVKFFNGLVGGRIHRKEWFLSSAASTPLARDFKVALLCSP